MTPDLDYTGMSLEGDNQFIAYGQCGTCFGSGCEMCCSGEEAYWVDLSILFRNIAVAGALTRAYRLGDYHGFESAAEQCSSCSGSWDDEDDRITKPQTWWPNMNGRAAP